MTNKLKKLLKAKTVTEVMDISDEITDEEKEQFVNDRNLELTYCQL